MTEKIILNAIRCGGCGMTLVSEHRHDFRSCSCGTFVDGGRAYFRRGLGDGVSFTDLSIVEIDGIQMSAQDAEALKTSLNRQEKDNGNGSAH